MKKKAHIELDRINSSELHLALGLRTRAAAAHWRSIGWLPPVQNAGKNSFYFVADVLENLRTHLDARAQQTYRDVKTFLKLRKELSKETHERT